MNSLNHDLPLVTAELTSVESPPKPPELDTSTLAPPFVMVWLRSPPESDPHPLMLAFFVIVVIAICVTGIVVICTR